MVIVELAIDPRFTLTFDGLALREKSGPAETWTVILMVCVRSPLTPVTLTVKIPLVEPVIVRVELPEPPVTMFGVKLDERLGSEALAESVTVAEKPDRDEIVMVDWLDPPVLKLILFGFAEIEKSWTVRLTITECEREPLVPVTFTA
jgi:hypothetical protein